MAAAITSQPFIMEIPTKHSCTHASGYLTRITPSVVPLTMRFLPTIVCGLEYA